MIQLNTNIIKNNTITAIVAIVTAAITNEQLLVHCSYNCNKANYTLLNSNLVVNTKGLNQSFHSLIKIKQK
jgi:hypothetical protein